MATEFFHPAATPGIAQILEALGVDCCVAGEQRQRFLVIPGNFGPRWLVPARSRAAISVLSAWHPYLLSNRMKWLGICIAAHTGALQFVPSVSSVDISRNGALRWLARCGVASPAGEMVVLVGNPSADRKLVAFLLDEVQRVAAVVKIALTERGRLSVLHEAETLRKLEGHNWSPKLQAVYPDQRAAAQGYVQGEMPGRRFRPEYMDILCRLPRSGGSRSLPHLAEEMARRLGPIKEQVDKMAPGLIDRSLDFFDLDISVPTMLVHGDLAPWNVRNNPQIGYVLLDWEWANFAGLPAYDLLHFQFNDDRLFGENSGGDSAARRKSIRAEYFRRMDLDPKLLPRLAAAYLLDQLESHFMHRNFRRTSSTLRQLASLAGDSAFIS